MTIISTKVKVYSYRSDGLHMVTHRKPGTTRPHDEVIPVDVEKEKERKRLAAQAKRNRAYADKFKEWD